MTRVGILDLGLSNLFSIRAALARLGAEPLVEHRPGREIDALVFPGVGNFSEAAARLEGLREELIDFARSGRPFLGICLGMQILFEESEEGPGRGLGLYGGKVRLLGARGKIPHMGWNTIIPVRNVPILEGVEPGEWVYFMHSYAPRPAEESVVLALTNYGGDEFPSVVGSANLFGTQFHPEKSGPTGRKILKNFLRLAKT
jgi:glutamine amidotransferase